MYKNKKIIAIIPAREGSKGVPNKNLKKILNKTLIQYTTDAAKKSSFIDKIIVSTDSIEIKNFANAEGLVCDKLRPEELSSDTAILYDVLKYELKKYTSFAIVLLLQPTSPLRTSAIIDDAIVQFIDNEYESAVSVHKVDLNPYLIRTINNNKLSHLLDENSTKRRQDLPSYFKVNGMLYINYIKDILGGYVSLNDNKHPIIVPREISIDIDEIKDFAKCEEILLNLK